MSSRPATISTLALVAILVGCDDGTTHDVEPVNVIDAVVDGRPFHVDDRPFYSSVAGEKAFMLLQGNTLMIVGQRGTGQAFEHLQVSLFFFDGVGTYVIDDEYSAHTGVGIYDQGDASWWSDGPPADSAWVTAYDSVSGEIEGTFKFVGRRYAGDTLIVSNGTFKGVVGTF